VRASGIHKAEALKSQWAETSPIVEFNDYEKAAPANQKKLAEVAANAVKDMPGVEWVDPGWKGATEKGLKRLAEKVERSRKGRVSDAARGGFMVNDPNNADEVMDKLAEYFEVADEGWQVTPEGYFDRKAMVRFPDGMMAEIQFWEPSMWKAKEKEGGHIAYENARSLPVGHPERVKYLKQMQELYGNVNSNLPTAWNPVLHKKKPLWTGV
jgi:hypothetical protein